MTMPAPLDQQSSIATARRSLAKSFRRHGLATPELDARLLVAYALGLDHAGLAAQAARALTAGESAAIAVLAARRLAREPVARIIDVKEFWGLSLRLNSATLVPRPETETVVEAALDAVDHRQARGEALALADLGTGSGALLLALLAELPKARGLGTDVSPQALRCARDNAIALGLAARAGFVACDYGAALKGPFDLIVTNPPYVARDDIATLAPEVRVFDPPLALDGGHDGLDAYRAIAVTAPRLLSPAGVLVLELGIGQHAAVEGLLAAAGLVPVGGPSHGLSHGLRHDLLGIARALAVQRLP
jgi:release factor glutamine methyltransferase